MTFLQSYFITLNAAVINIFFLYCHPEGIFQRAAKISTRRKIPIPKRDPVPGRNDIKFYKNNKDILVLKGNRFDAGQFSKSQQFII
jgi:hypothetical protein